VVAVSFIFGFEDHADSLTDDQMIVSDQDANSHGMGIFTLIVVP
jgi:hypothetical protein